MRFVGVVVVVVVVVVAFDDDCDNYDDDVRERQSYQELAGSSPSYLTYYLLVRLLSESDDRSLSTTISCSEYTDFLSLSLLLLLMMMLFQQHYYYYYYYLTLLGPLL